ncbi:hypothetical protein AC1031_009367 [Aphanomyces cochlioides]|nr:hypothetical protein AC1031_009367 [Aphanomyces cochlioides]
MENTKTMETPSLAKLRSQFEKQEQLNTEEALQLIHRAHDIMDKEANVLYLDAPVVVFGDIHGQFFDLMKLLDKCKFFHPSFAESDQTLLFLGDYVDRGAFSCEVMLFLLCMKIHYPTHVFLLRGNHECEAISSFYGFRLECKGKYGLSVYYHFTQCFQALPLAAVVSASEGRVFCVHAGLSPSLKSLSDIDAIERRQEPATTGALCDLLWSDPVPEYEGEVEESPSTIAAAPRQQFDTPDSTKWRPNGVRGCSFYYNCTAVYDFLTANNLMCMVRAHEMQDEGYLFHFSSPAYFDLDTRPAKEFPPVISVFSAANYCDTYGNMAAYLVIQKTSNRFDVEQTRHVVHPYPRSFRQSEGIWATFQATLPYIPASKDFFETMAQLNHVPKSDNTTSTDDNLQSSDRDIAEKPPDANGGSRRRLTRRNSYEKHPQALSKELDAITKEWKTQREEVSTPTRRASLHQREVVDVSFTPKEIEVLKLIFALMDTDGDLKLGADEIARFIKRILGETINEQRAQRYVQALDYNQDGHVDLNDLLSCAALLKKRYNSRMSTISILSRWLPWTSTACVLAGVFFLYRRFGRRYRWVKQLSMLVLTLIAITFYSTRRRIK